MVKEAQIELAVKACVWCDYRELPYYPENIVMALDNLGLLADGNLTTHAVDGATHPACLCPSYPLNQSPECPVHNDPPRN